MTMIRSSSPWVTFAENHVIGLTASNRPPAFPVCRLTSELILHELPGNCLREIESGKVFSAVTSEIKARLLNVNLVPIASVRFHIQQHQPKHRTEYKKEMYQ